MCGKLFNDTGHKVCMECYAELEKKEQEVVNYVRDHRGAKVAEICEATGAPTGMIKKMIREGRFEQIGVKMTYPCEKCGAPIITGKICQQCEEKARAELQKQAALQTAARQMAKADQNRGQGFRSKER